jgi:hypothetical protein
MLRIQAEERQVAEWRIGPEQFAGQVKVEVLGAPGVLRRERESL